MKPTSQNQFGITDPICPYCHHALDQKPKSKKKCPHCGNFIYVRTRPSDHQKILITEAQIPMLEQLYQEEALRREIEDLRSDPEYRKIEKQLQKKNNTEPKPIDILWQLHLPKLSLHAKNNDWGLYRNEKLHIAQYFEKFDMPKPALDHYLLICYIDLNGPQNRGGTPPDLLKIYPMFDLKWSTLFPGILSSIIFLMEKLDLNFKQVEQSILKVSNGFWNTRELPMKPEKAWQILYAELIKEQRRS